MTSPQGPHHVSRYLRLPLPGSPRNVPRCSAGSSLRAVREEAFRQESGVDGLPWAADPRASTPGGDVPTWPSSPDAVVSATGSVRGRGRCYYHRGDASHHGSESQNDCFSSPRCIYPCHFHYYFSLAFTSRLRAGFPERGESSAGALCPQGTLGSVWRHSGPPSWMGGSGHYHVGAGEVAGCPVMHRAALNREPSGAEWRWGIGLLCRPGVACCPLGSRSLGS